MRNTTRAYLEGCTPKLLWLWLWHANESRHRHDFPQGSIQSCIIGQVVYKSLNTWYMIVWVTGKRFCFNTLWDLSDED